MPITAEKKQLLVDLLKEMTDVERVKITGAVYDSLVTAELPWADLFFLSKAITENIYWNLLPSQFGPVQVMIVRSIDEVLLKSLPDILDRSPETKQFVADLVREVGGLELVKIASAAYNGFVEAGLSLDKSFAISKQIFARVPWKRLPAALGNEQVLLIKGITTKLISQLADIIETAVVLPDAPPEATEASQLPAAPSSDIGQTAMTFVEAGPLAVPVLSASPPITPTTRSEIDDLDEDASMHGLDTESLPEGGEKPVSVSTTAAIEEDPGAPDQEEATSDAADEVDEEVGDDNDDDVPSEDDVDDEGPRDPAPPKTEETSTSANHHDPDTVVDAEEPSIDIEVNT